MLIAFVIFIIQTFLTLGHFFLYRTVVKFFNVTDPTAIFNLKIAFLILSFLFTFASVISFQYYGTVARGFYTISAVWLGTTYWLLLASFLAWAIYGITSVFSAQRIGLLLGSGLLVLALCVSAYGVWNSYQTKVRQITVTLKNLPKNWKGKKIALVADTHLGHVRNVNFSKKIADLVAKQKPDIVLIPGDFYDGTPAQYKTLAEPFGKIPSTFGTFFSPGNHEEFRNPNLYTEALSSAGIKVLANTKVEVEGLQIIGITFKDALTAKGEESILNSLKLDPKMPSILLKHEPSQIPTAEKAGISLQVSGHTHMGQVFPLSFITKKVYKNFNYKLKSFGNMQVYTTSGAGTWGPPQRVGTNSEIVIITLE